MKKGDLIAELENLDLKLEIAQLEGERDSYQAQVEEPREDAVQPDAATLPAQARRVSRDSSPASRLSSAKSKPTSSGCGSSPRATAWSSRRRARPSGRRRTRRSCRAGPARRWIEKNIGATLSPEGPQNLLCQIGDPNEWDAVLVIDQDDIDLVQRGRKCG